MFNQIKPAVLMLLLITIVTGLVYPLLTTALAQVLFPAKANGSLIERDGKLVGSRLIGQNFSEAKYFWGRLSATAPYPYNAAASSGSNLGPLNPALADAAKARIDALAKADAATGAGTPARPVPIDLMPIDLITASGSGLDPHISVAAAEFQLARVARARGIPQAQVRDRIAAHTKGKWLGVFGEPHVNVLELNLDLDAMK
jgi:K+-transporting ATPase ATPase C chain